MDERRCINKSLISEYLDGELAADVLKDVEEHLANCPDCQTAYEHMRAHCGFLLEHMPEPEPPPHMKQQLFRRIRALPEGSRHAGIMGWPGIGRLFPSTSRIWTFAYASVIFLAVAVSAFQYQRYREDARILAEIDRSRIQWIALDRSINPFNIDINGAPLQVPAENPFKDYLNER